MIITTDQIKNIIYQYDYAEDIKNNLSSGVSVVECKGLDMNDKIFCRQIAGAYDSGWIDIVELDSSDASYVLSATYIEDSNQLKLYCSRTIEQLEHFYLTNDISYLQVSANDILLFNQNLLIKDNADNLVKLTINSFTAELNESSMTPIVLIPTSYVCSKSHKLSYSSNEGNIEYYAEDNNFLTLTYKNLGKTYSSTTSLSILEDGEEEALGNSGSIFNKGGDYFFHVNSAIAGRDDNTTFIENCNPYIYKWTGTFPLGVKNFYYNGKELEYNTEKELCKNYTYYIDESARTIVIKSTLVEQSGEIIDHKSFEHFKILYKNTDFSIYYKKPESFFTIESPIIFKEDVKINGGMTLGGSLSIPSGQSIEIDTIKCVDLEIITSASEAKKGFFYTNGASIYWCKEDGAIIGINWNETVYKIPIKINNLQ